MRQALVSLFAAAAVATPVFAQDASTTATPAPEATASTVTTQTPDATVTTTVTQTPAATVTTTVSTPTEPEPAPAALPPTPNDPTTLQVLSTLDRVCKPLVTGGDVVAITKPLGFKKKRDVYTLNLAKPASITVTPSSANPNVCNFEVLHPLGGDKDITIGLHNWAIGQGYTLYRNDEYTTDLKRHTRSWEKTADGKTEALVFITETKNDGSATNKNATRSTVMYSVR